MKNLRYKFQLALVFVMAVSSVPSLKAMGDSLVWSIGKRDNSYWEYSPLAIGNFPDRYPTGPVVVSSGTDALKDWSGILPGPVDGWARPANRKATIRFLLAQSLTGKAHLLIDTVDTHGVFAPRLSVRLNSHPPVYQSFRPGIGDPVLLNPTLGREQLMQVVFPPEWLKVGENRLELEIVEGSWLLFDAVELKDTGDPSPAMIQALKIEPSVCLIKRADQLQRLIDLRAENPLAADLPIDITGTLAGLVITATSMMLPYGENHIPLAVAEPAQSSTLTIQVSWPGGSWSDMKIVTPIPQYEIYILQHSHFDNGYTHRQSQVLEKQFENLKTVIAMCERTAHYPSESQYRWTCESFYLVERFLAECPEYRERFMKYCREGRIEITGLYANMLTGLLSGEELFRSIEPAAEFCRAWDIPFDAAMICDVPGYSAQLPQALNKAGLRYFSCSPNDIRAPFLQNGKPPAFWWESPDGSKVLTWCHRYGYGEDQAFSIGKDMEKSRGAMNVLLPQFAGERELLALSAAFLGEAADNARASTESADWVRRWNELYVWPRLRLATAREFFIEYEKRYGSELPTYRGDWTGYWEDGAASSARETAKARKTQGLLKAAELLHTWNVLSGTGYYPAAEFEQAWRDLWLYNEHTWGAAQSISDPTSLPTLQQWAVKAGYVRDAYKTAEQLVRRGLDCLSRNVQTTGPVILVFNPSGATRTDIVRFRPPQGYYAPALLDENGKRYVCQWRRDGTAFFLAENVPAMGYKCLNLINEVGAHINDPKSQKLPYDQAKFSTLYYTFQWDPASGAVISIQDRQTGKELVDAAGPYGFNTWFYEWTDRPRAVSNEMYNTSAFTRESQKLAKVVRVDEGPVAYTISLESTLNGFDRIMQDILLYKDLKRIDFNHTVRKLHVDGSRVAEAAYVAYPFALKSPEFVLDLPGAMVSAPSGQIPGSCYNWYALRGAVMARNSKAFVCLAVGEAPMMEIGDVYPNRWLEALPVDRAWFFSNPFNNYWFTNYKASQGGVHEFHYSLTSGEINSSTQVFHDAAFWWMEPLESRALPAGQKGLFPSSASLLSASSDHVEILSLRLAGADEVRVRIAERKNRAGKYALQPMGRPLLEGEIQPNELYSLSLSDNVFYLGEMTTDKAVLESASETIALESILSATVSSSSEEQ